MATPRNLREEPGLVGYVRMVDHLPRLEREEELALARRYRDGDKGAGDALVEAHLRSVVKLAQRYRGYGIYLSDLIAEGNLGLLEALRRFDPDRELRFLTYARYWIRAYILAHVLKHFSIVDLGTSSRQSKLFFRLQAEHSRLTGMLGAGHSSIEARLAEKFDTSVEDVRSSLERLGRRDASLDSPVSLDGALTFVDLLTDDDEPDQEARIAAAEEQTMVREVLDRLRPTLDDRERLIVDRRLLPRDGEAETLAALGRTLGVTRERVRQLEVGLKSKLRRLLGEVIDRTPKNDGAGSLGAAA